MIKDKYIHIRGSRLHYATAGHGEKHMLVFHGFGQDMSAFEHLSRTFARHYTFYVFDLYFHGRSEWAHGQDAITTDEWKQTIAAFLQENHLERFSMAGFSLGAKFVFSTFASFPDRVEKVLLIAPDGIHRSFWYSIATHPFGFMRLFKSMIDHPERFEKMATLLHRSGLVDKALIRLAEYQMGTAERRRRVYYSWIVFRKLSYKPSKLAELFNKYETPVTLIAGKNDHVIELRHLKKFASMIKRIRIEVLDTGHSGLINQSIAYFGELDQSSLK